MERVDKLIQTVDVVVGAELGIYEKPAGRPKIVFPKKFGQEEGLLSPGPQLMTGRVYNESTLRALADVYERALGLAHRPPLEKFLAEKDAIFAGEEFPDESKLHLDEAYARPQVRGIPMDRPAVAGYRAGTDG